MIAGPDSKDAPEFNDENILRLVEEHFSRASDFMINMLAKEAIEQGYRAFKEDFYEDWEEWDMDRYIEP